MMAEPEHAGDEEAQGKGDETRRIESGEFAPSGRRAELRRARQVIGQQRHRHSEDGVAQRL